ncbi:MAG TPA: MOSC N-terminal beta barrel domain-containing protein [Longimicrobiales bacterium]
MLVSELYFYPIKSMRGIMADRVTLDERGARNDRRWMLVDDDGVFISQREAPRMALIDVLLRGDALLVGAPGMELMRIPLEPEGSPARCTIWSDTVDAVPVSRTCDDWFSSFLGRPCRLVHMPDTTRRVVDPSRVPHERIVGFADAYPLLIIGQASLDALNARLVAAGESPVEMHRFRPNVVVAKAAPHAEDDWRHVRIGSIDVDVVKPCSRCTIPTVDVDTGVMGKEPLRTLSTYRKQGSKVMFGQNAVHRRAGSIAVGDPVTVASVA